MTRTSSLGPSTRLAAPAATATSAKEPAGLRQGSYPIHAQVDIRSTGVGCSYSGHRREAGDLVLRVLSLTKRGEKIALSFADGGGTPSQFVDGLQPKPDGRVVFRAELTAPSKFAEGDKARGRPVTALIQLDQPQPNGARNFSLQYEAWNDARDILTTYTFEGVMPASPSPA